MLPQILLLGATGRVGSILLKEALRRGHQVTILLRKAPVTDSDTTSALPSSDRLTTIIGDPCAFADVERALLATTPGVPIVIISTLGQTRRSGNPWAAPTSPAGFMTRSASAVLSACSATRAQRTVRKFVVLSIFGAGDSFANLNFLMRWIMLYSQMRQTKEDHDGVERALKGQTTGEEVPYVLVRAPMLSFAEGEEAEAKLHGQDGTGASWMPKVNAGSVVKFILDVAAAEGEAGFEGKTPMISN